LSYDHFKKQKDLLPFSGETDSIATP
jgi:hypothetical protein